MSEFTDAELHPGLHSRISRSSSPGRTGSSSLVASHVVGPPPTGVRKTDLTEIDCRHQDHNNYDPNARSEFNDVSALFTSVEFHGLVNLRLAKSTINVWRFQTFLLEAGRQMI
jgi:hypothetical protein